MRKFALFIACLAALPALDNVLEGTADQPWMFWTILFPLLLFVICKITALLTRAGNSR